MQKTLFAIVLALTMSFALADYSAENFVKPPVPVCNDSETNFTNQLGLTIDSLALTDLTLISLNGKADPQNPNNVSFTAWTRKLDTKALTQGANNTYTFSTASTNNPEFVDGYVFFVTTANDSANITQLYVNQFKLDGNSVLPRFAFTTNNNSAFVPSLITFYVSGKTVFLYSKAGDKVVNVTSFTAGGSAVGKIFNLTNAYDGLLAISSGQAISSSQNVAVWIEGDSLKEAVVDASKGSVNSVTVGGFTKNQSCTPYVTDKKLYGTVCTWSNTTHTFTNVRTNTTNLAQLYVVPLADNTILQSFPYSAYWTFVFQGKSGDNTTLSHEMWDLDKLALFKNRTRFLNYQANSTQEIYRIPGGGVYALLYNRAAADKPLTSVQVGQVLASSHLASIFGFLLAAIAGLFLF